MRTRRDQRRKKVRVDLGQPLGQVVLQVTPSNVVTPTKPLNPRQLAEFLGVSPATIKRHASEWPSFKIGDLTKFDAPTVIKHLMDKAEAEKKK